LAKIFFEFLINSKDSDPGQLRCSDPGGQLRCTDPPDPDPHTVDTTDINYGYDDLAPKKLADQGAARIWRVGRTDKALPAL
jgi:hypothetical protein